MAYTDVNDVLPYPRGGQPGQPIPPGQAGMSWLQYLNAMFGGPQADAAAGTLGANMATGQPMQLPGNAPAAPVGSTMPPVNALDALVSRPPGYLNSTSPINGVPAADVGNRPPGYLNSTGATGGMPAAQVGNPLNYNMPWPSGGGSVNPTGGSSVNPNAQANVPVNARTPAVNPRATGGQSMQGVTANNDRFIPIQYQTGGGGQGGRNAPIYTAMNFGGPQTAAMLAPQGSMRPPGPMARGGGRSPQGGGFYGAGVPDLSGIVGAPDLSGLSPDLTDIAGAAGGLPPGRQQMSPADLASAVNQPDWLQRLLGRATQSPAALARAVRQPNYGLT